MENLEDSVSGHPHRKRLPHEIPWWVPGDSAWFITINCKPPRKPQLCATDPAAGAAMSILDSARFYHAMDEPRWFIHCFLLMPDHLHAILSFPQDIYMERTITAWKGYVRRRYGIIWQSGFFDHRLRSDDQRIEKLDYIRMNPVRKGFCERPEDWPHVLSFDPRSGEELS